MSEQWTDIGAVEDFPENDVKGVQAGACDLAVYQVDGDLFATDNLCSHGHARLCDGFLEGHEIECLLHQGRFDVRNGKAMCAPLTTDIAVYPVRLTDGRVLVKLG